MTECEFDHVFYGEFNGEPRPNPDEVDDWTWLDPAKITADLEKNPHDYTPWFKIALHKATENRPGGANPVLVQKATERGCFSSVPARPPAETRPTA